MIYAQRNDTCQLHCLENASHLRGKAPETLHSEATAYTFGYQNSCFFFFGTNLLSPLMQLMTSHLRWIDDFWKNVCIFEMLLTFLKSCSYTSTLKGAWSFWPCLRFIHDGFIKQLHGRIAFMRCLDPAVCCISCCGETPPVNFPSNNSVLIRGFQEILTLKSNDIQIKHLQAQVLVILVAWKL